MKGLSSEQIDNISTPDMQVISVLLPLHEKKEFDRVRIAVNHGLAGVKD